MVDHVVIAGASVGGIKTARGLRRRGFDGRITLIGAEPHTPYDRPPLSKQVLTDHDGAALLGLEPQGFLDGLDLRLGVRAVGLDAAARSVALEDGTEVVGDHLVIATGAAARWLPGTRGIEGVGVLRSLDDATWLRAELRDREPRRVAIIGAGFIGCEVAASARTLGHHVTVVEPLQAPVVRGLGPVLGGVVADLHRERGVELRLGVGVTELVADAGRVTGLRLADGSLVEAHVVVVGIGAAPVTDWLEGSGLRVDNGVVCDDWLRAEGGNGRVWAVGDVARFPSTTFRAMLRLEHWDNAVAQGLVVAQNILGDAKAGPYDPVPYVWSDQYEHKFQVVGHPSGDDDVELVAGSFAERRFVATYARDGVVTGVVGLDRPKPVLTSRPLIAAHATPAEVAAHVASLPNP